LRLKRVPAPVSAGVTGLKILKFVWHNMGLEKMYMVG